MKNRICPYVSLAAALFLLLSSYPIAGQADGADTVAPMDAVTVAEDSYTAYLQAHTEAKPATETIVLPPQAGVKTDGSALTPTAVDGRPALEIGQESGTVVWQVNVPQTGLYEIEVDYYPIDSKSGEIQVEVLLDGKLPFSGTRSVLLPKLYRDEVSEFERDNRGNDMRPSQLMEQRWLTTHLLDDEGYAVDPYRFYFEQGTHTLAFTSLQQDFAVGEIRLTPPVRRVDYAAYREQYSDKTAGNGEKLYIIEAEKTYSKTSPMLYPLPDRSSPATSTVHPTQTRLNTIGGENWKGAQQTITWKITVEEDGFYSLGFRYRQTYLRGLYVSRRIEVDGEVPFEEFNQVPFSYNSKWQVETVGGEEPYYLYLTAGEHEIAMTPTLGDVASYVERVNHFNYELNDLYRRIIMVTSVNPDLYRDYVLQEAVPGMVEEMRKIAAGLREIYDAMCEKTGHKGSESASLLRMAEQLESFAKEPDTIPARLSSFRDNITSLSTWVLTMGDQCLLLDTLWLAQPNAVQPAANKGFFDTLWFQIQAFIGSFFQDYNSVGNRYDSDTTINVWISSGRDQAEVIKRLIDEEFSATYGVSVNLSVVQGALLQATMAGKGPDVALQLGHGDPVNMALREALEPLEGYDGFNDLLDDYVEGSFLPYQLKGHTYALPETQNFLMMFYRTDVFEELSLTPPNTWQELYDVAEVLQGYNMEVGLPYVSMDAYSVVSAGMGTQSIFPTMLAQRGLSLYNEDLTETALDKPEAYEVFKQWTDFYTKYGFPVYKDDYNRFRTGQMPLTIVTYTFYNQLYTAAPEIRNLWAMVPIPATVRKDGTLDRSMTASGSSCVMLAAADHKEACWSFLKWWAGADTQGKYGNEIENVLGSAGRYNPASIEALKQMAWSGAELSLLLEQQQNLVEIPEIPGGYYTSRNVDNAFKRVFYQNENPRNALNYWNREINEEITRKRKEFGLDGGTVS